jgi:hypothetical protein
MATKSPAWWKSGVRQKVLSVITRALRTAIQYWVVAYGTFALLYCYGVLSLDNLSSALDKTNVTYVGCFIFLLSVLGACTEPSETL